jgi:hypothetical protein
MRRGKGYLVPQGRETRRWRLCRRRRWGRSIRGGRRGVRSRGREVRRGRLAPRCTRPGRRPPADPPGAAPRACSLARRRFSPPLPGNTTTTQRLGGACWNWNSCSRLAGREKEKRPSLLAALVCFRLLARLAACVLPLGLARSGWPLLLPSLFSGF